MQLHRIPGGHINSFILPLYNAGPGQKSGEDEKFHTVIKISVLLSCMLRRRGFVSVYGVEKLAYRGGDAA